MILSDYCFLIILILIYNKIHMIILIILLQKAVLKLELHDEKAKKKAMKTVSGHSGIELFYLFIAIWSLPNKL